jgi:hypothetical protein
VVKPGNWACVRRAGAEVWTKKVEAFSALGDDRQVIALYEQARAAGDLAHYPSALFYHLVAVSMAFLGREREARQLWKRALQYDASLNVAQENLAEKNLRSARTWLEMWEKADPEHPQLGVYRELIARSGGLLRRINPFR